MGARRREADLQDILRAAAGMQDHPPPSLAMRIDEVIDGCGQRGLRQRGNDESVLPGAVGLAAPMLDRASAADAEVRTDRRHPLRALRFDPQQLPAIGVTGDRLDRDGFARKRVGHIDRAVGRVGNTVAAVADMRND
jgi:hypothetical protein